MLLSWAIHFACLTVRQVVLVVEDVTAVGLGHQVEALCHAVGCESGFGVMVPAFSDGVTQGMHALKWTRDGGDLQPEASESGEGMVHQNKEAAELP